LTLFLLACAGLVLLSGVFLLFPRSRPGISETDLDRANLEWFLRRRAELREHGDEALEADAQLRLLEEAGTSGAQPVAAPRSFPSWVLLPLVAALAAGLYYHLGAAEDVVIAERLRAISAESSPEELAGLVHTVEARSAERPDNLHYLALLGQYYLGEQDYARAVQTYDALAAGAPGDAQVLAYSAQASYLASGRTLTDRARLRAEQALAVDPHQRTALGLLGMASFEQRQYGAAISYWQRLLAVEAPGSESAQMIAGVIDTARQRLAAGEGVAPVAAEPAAVPTAGAGVTVRVELPSGASVAPTDTVFVLARNADSGSRMPVAVQRLTAAQLPLTLRLDDSNSMAGQKLSGTASVIVAVQVSPGGRPGEDGATWLGQAGPLTPSLSVEPVAIELRPNSGETTGSNQDG